MLWDGTPKRSHCRCQPLKIKHQFWPLFYQTQERLPQPALLARVNLKSKNIKAHEQDPVALWTISLCCHSHRVFLLFIQDQSKAELFLTGS